jgi:hypothetical protein
MSCDRSSVASPISAENDLIDDAFEELENDRKQKIFCCKFQ